VRAGELNAWWRWGALLTIPIVRALFRVRVEGLEHVPASGSAILAFNHVSSLDGPVLAIEIAWRHRRESRFLVAAEFFERPLIGMILRRFDQIPIQRGTGDGAALEDALGTVRRGALAAIAPEGGVNADGAVELQRIRRGVARIAIPTRSPIVPVGMWGTQRRWPRSGLRLGPPWRPTLAIAFGPPLLASDEDVDDAAIDDVTARLRERLTAQVARARALAGGDG
jgi:1-acyl-sn-glycerol-3-phosphate acyltransferase